MLRGDELGALLGAHLVARGVAQPVDGATSDGESADGESADGAQPTFACSIVSSQLLGRIAAAAGLAHAETLTGFKWIARVPGLVYGYEEALGYCVAPQVVRDKDGVSAALLVAELAASLKAKGRSLLDALDDLAVRHGVHATDQLAVRVDDLALIGQAMARLRAHPPSELAGQSVVVDDLMHPTDASALPATDGLRYRTDGGLRVVVRPSGTEPKLKCYLEAVVPVTGTSAEALAQAREVAGQLLARTGEELRGLLGLTDG
jgi:phosphomannomutase